MSLFKYSLKCKHTRESLPILDLRKKINWKRKFSYETFDLKTTKPAACSLLRQEESKLLDLLTTVARKSGDSIEPTKERNKSRSSVLFAKERTGSIRPGISSLQRENATTKSAVVELQALLDQSFLDMKNLRVEKDKEIQKLAAAAQKMVRSAGRCLPTDNVTVLFVLQADQTEALRDKGTVIAHYSNLFISSTLTGIERGNITCPETTQVCLLLFSSSDY